MYVWMQACDQMIPATFCIRNIEMTTAMSSQFSFNTNIVRYVSSRNCCEAKMKLYSNADHLERPRHLQIRSVQKTGTPDLCSHMAFTLLYLAFDNPQRSQGLVKSLHGTSVC
jgi:hypothetical protein